MFFVLFRFFFSFLITLLTFGNYMNKKNTTVYNTLQLMTYALSEEYKRNIKREEKIFYRTGHFYKSLRHLKKIIVKKDFTHLGDGQKNK